MATITLVAETHNDLGEGPLWVPDTQQLYWIDLFQGGMWHLDLATGDVASTNIGLPIGCIANRQGGGFVLATKRGFATWQPGSDPEWLADPEADLADNRFNDGKVDSQGRFWAATVSDGADQAGVPHGSLYRLDPDGTVRCMDTGFFVSNGLGWSPDDRTLYFTDSIQRIIYAYDFAAATGEVGNRRPFVRVPERGGLPDGMAVDAEGYIWSACWGASRIVRYAPDGQVEREVTLPVTHPTSCAFGGPNLTTLYVTSAQSPVPLEERAAQPLAGAVFSLTAPVPGLPIPAFAG